MRLTAIFLFFKEQHFMEATLRAVYPVVDAISAITQYDRSFHGKTITPDGSISKLLALPDPENKIRLTLARDLSEVVGQDAEAKLRNLAMRQDSEADYYLILDSDEIWPRDVLESAWKEIQRTQYSAYRISTTCYFRNWNFQVQEPGDGYRPLVFLRRGFSFKTMRQVDWRSWARWKEYARLGRKPKTIFFPSNWKMHHGSGVGDDSRILTKLSNYGHESGVDPEWFDKVWKNFSAETKNFHYFKDGGALYESIRHIPTAELPAEIRELSWPEGWIER